MVVRTGLARKPWTNYKTANYCIAYLDILGAKDKICNDKDFGFLNHLNMFMEDAIEESGKGIFPRKEEIFIKIFSDNILLAIELKENDKQRDHKIAILFNIVANIYNEILCYGHLMRGAIVEGEFFHNENIVYGEALVRAVKIEEKEAIYPRIIVQDKIAQLLLQYCLQDSKDEKFILNTFLLSECFDHINFKFELLEMLKQNKNNEHIKEKIMWMINYFNNWFMSPEAHKFERPQITDAEIQEAMQP